jgi:hypothetical protein
MRTLIALDTPPRGARWCRSMLVCRSSFFPCSPSAGSRGRSTTRKPIACSFASDTPSSSVHSHLNSTILMTTTTVELDVRAIPRP